MSWNYVDTYQRHNIERDTRAVILAGTFEPLNTHGRAVIVVFVFVLYRGVESQHTFALRCVARAGIESEPPSLIRNTNTNTNTNTKYTCGAAEKAEALAV